ncbi:MAG: hypothetical protein KAW41_05915 [Candidatus Diapherotrites archaeon]|nr:hypothetical protein [Candidatus Diapherotrites archaeon]
MEPEKSQLDTLELYLRKMVSEEKTKELIRKFVDAGEDVADKAIKLFETRHSVRLQDIERLLEGA